MEEDLNSDSPSGINWRISTDSGGAGDHQSLEVEHSNAPCPIEKPGFLALDLSSSKEEGQTVEAGDGSFVSGDSETTCGVLGEDMQETENGKGKEESAGSDFEAGGVANGKGAGSGLLGETTGEDSGKLGSEGGVVGIGPEKKDEAVVEDFGCSLEIELIDDTAVIGLSKIGIDLETAGRKNGKKELDCKKEKRPRRRAKGAKKGSDSAGDSTGCKGKGNRTKMVYLRREMEALRYSNVKGQRKLWQDIYSSFSPSVRTEYDELGSFRHQNKQSGSRLDPYPASGTLGMAAAVGGENFLDYYGGGGYCLTCYRQGGNCLNLYRGGGDCLNFYGYRRFASS